MARTNVKAVFPKTHEGGVASSISNLEMLKRSVMSCLLWEDSFYENGISVAERIQNLTKILKDKAIPVMLDAKHKSKLRHVPLWMAVSLAQVGSLKADDLYSIITRPDDMTEFLAMYWANGKKPLAKQVKLGLAKAITKFSAYQLAKYDRDGLVKLRDVIRMVHPVPNNEEQSNWFKTLSAGEKLPTPDTWEVALAGGADKKETFTRLISENKLGDLAFLRNLRNIIESGVNSGIVKDYFSTRKWSKILPYQFITAARYAPTLEPQIETAMFQCLADIKKIGIPVALLVDGSGSMESKISGKSELSCFDTACGLAILVRELFDDVRTYVYSEKEKAVPARRGFALRDALHAAAPWSGTNTQTCINNVGFIENKVMIVITDEQSSERMYINVPDDHVLFVINVASYQNGIMYQKNVVHISGWSESSVKFIVEYLKENKFISENPLDKISE